MFQKKVFGFTQEHFQKKKKKNEGNVRIAYVWACSPEKTNCVHFEMRVCRRVELTFNHDSISQPTPGFRFARYDYTNIC